MAKTMEVDSTPKPSCVAILDGRRRDFNELQRSLGGLQRLERDVSVTSSEVVFLLGMWMTSLERCHRYAHMGRAISESVCIPRNAPLTAMKSTMLDGCHVQQDDLPLGTQVTRAILGVAMSHASRNTVQDMGCELSCAHCNRTASEVECLMTRLPTRSCAWASSACTLCSGCEGEGASTYAGTQSIDGAWKGDAVCAACLYTQVIHPGVLQAYDDEDEDSSWFSMMNWSTFRTYVGRHLANAADGAPPCFSDALGYCILGFHRVVSDPHDARQVSLEQITSMASDMPRRFVSHVLDVPDLDRHVADAATNLEEIDCDCAKSNVESIGQIKKDYRMRKREAENLIVRRQELLKEAKERRKAELCTLYASASSRETPERHVQDNDDNERDAPRRRPQKRPRTEGSRYVLELIQRHVDDILDGESELGVERSRRLSPISIDDISVVRQFMCDLRDLINNNDEDCEAPRGGRRAISTRYLVPILGEKVGDTPTRCRICGILGHGTGNRKNSCPFAHGVPENCMFDAASDEPGSGRGMVDHHNRTLKRLIANHREALMQEMNNVEGLLHGWTCVMMRNRRMLDDETMGRLVDPSTDAPSLDIINMPIHNDGLGAIMVGLREVRNSITTPATVDNFYNSLINAIKREASVVWKRAHGRETDDSSDYRRVLIWCAANEVRNWRQARDAPSNANNLIVLGTSSSWSVLVDAVSADTLMPHQLLDMAGFTRPAELRSYAKSLSQHGFSDVTQTALDEFLRTYTIRVDEDDESISMESIFRLAECVIAGVAFYEYECRAPAMASIDPVEWIIRRRQTHRQDSHERAIETAKSTTNSLVKQRDSLFDWFILLAVVTHVKHTSLTADRIKCIFEKYNIVSTPRNVETIESESRENIARIVQNIRFNKAAFGAHVVDCIV